MKCRRIKCVNVAGRGKPFDNIRIAELNEVMMRSNEKVNST